MRSDLRQKRRAYLKGKRAEWVAALYLTFKGYEILKRRFKTPMGEIDLLARKGKTLVAIEVKTRGTLDKASLAITPFQQRRIKNAFLFYLAGQSDKFDLRFDVVLISPWKWPSHIQGAWVPRGF